MLKGNQAPVGDGHAVGIASHVLQDLLGASKRWFGIDYPFAPHAFVKPAEEVSVLSKRLQLAMKTELRFVKSPLRQTPELSPEQPA
jgi:hypothetical protein